MPSASINGTEIYYEVHGEGPALVFSHGGQGNHAIWWQQTTYFRQWYQVIAFDHRGFGRSKELPEGPDIRDYVEDLKQLLDHLGIERCSTVAQSMGGMACLGLAAKYPHRVQAMVMAGTNGRLDEARLLEIQERNRPIAEKLSNLDRVITKDFQQREPGLALLFSQIAGFNKATRQSQRGGDNYKGPTPQEVINAGVPILWVVGEVDPIWPPEAIKRSHQLIPGSELAVLHRVGHSTYWERPDLFNYMVHTFLEKHGVLGKGVTRPAVDAAAVR